jgi:hypothetical protein
MKIVIELQLCEECKKPPYSNNPDLLKGIAYDLYTQLDTVSAVISSNREHIKEIRIEE